MPARTGFAIALAALACSPAWAANPLDDLIKPEANASACFGRVYDAAHLRGHPRQKTKAMTVWLKYRPPLSGGSGIILSAALAITQRDDPAPLYSQGGCGWDERANRDTSNHRLIKAYPKEAGTVCMQSARPDVFDAVSAEEGGDLILDRGRDRNTLVVYLDEGLTMVKRADRGNLRGIEFGAEDRVFLLRRTGLKECEAVEEAVTAPEPPSAR